jgi:hypothetical protein
MNDLETQAGSGSKIIKFSERCIQEPTSSSSRLPSLLASPEASGSSSSGSKGSSALSLLPSNGTKEDLQQAPGAVASLPSDESSIHRLDLCRCPVSLEDTEELIRGGVFGNIVLSESSQSTELTSTVDLIDGGVDASHLPQLVTKFGMSGEHSESIVDRRLLVEDPTRELHRFGEKTDDIEIADKEVEEAREVVSWRGVDRLDEGGRESEREGRRDSRQLSMPIQNRSNLSLCERSQ